MAELENRILTETQEDEKVDLPEVEKALWVKVAKCPACGEEIALWNVRESSYRIAGRDTDFRTIYQGPVDPMFYDVWVCQVCLYASRRENFLELTPSEAERIEACQDERFKIARCGEFVGVRSREAAVKSYLLSEICYKNRRTSYETIAGLHLRVAWLFRGFKDEKRDKAYLQKALENYMLSYEKERSMKGKLGEDGLVYLIGELNRRLERDEEALKYFGIVLRNRGSRPEFRRMADEASDKVKSKKSQAGDEKIRP